jgi:TPR repeat protein
VPLLLIAIVLGIINFHFQSATGTTDLQVDTRFKIYFISKAIPFYLSKIIAPLNLSVLYPYHNVGPEHLAQIKYHILILVFLVGLVAFSYRYSKKVIFGTALFLITLAPVLKIIPVGDTFAADRYMYIPSIGIFYLVSVTLAHILSRKIASHAVVRTAVLFTVCLWIIVLSALTWERFRVWKDAESLSLDVLRQHPTHPLANNNLGTVYAEKGEYDKAILCFEKVLLQKTSPAMRAMAQHNLELAYRNIGKGPKGVSRQAGQSFGKNEAALFNKMGIEQGRFGNLDEAIRLFEKALALDPKFAETYNNLGYAYTKRGDLVRAADYFRKALEIDPNHAKARANLEYVNAELGKSEGAKRGKP